MLVHFVHNSTGLKFNETEISELDCGELFAYKEHGVFFAAMHCWLAELLESKMCNPY
jgi:hypothetical protein